MKDTAPLYPAYIPEYNPLEKVPLQGPFEYIDPGLKADPAKPNLLGGATKVFDLAPLIGTEIHGVQLSELTSAGLDELALLTAERGAVVFRDQNFADAGFERQMEVARHFGPLQVHGWMPHPVDGPPEFTIVYDSRDDLRIRTSWKGKSAIQFHVDQSAERQPPGLTFFCMLEQPSTPGGDTIFSSMSGALEKMSPGFAKRLEGLQSLHTTAAPVSREIRDNGAKSNLRRPVTENIHPVITVHPVTGKKCLFVNSSYSQRIIGYNDEESECMLKYLFDHVNRGQDFACRVRYEVGTVIVWDQRCTQHSQTLDYLPGDRRHAFRLTPLANVPIGVKSVLDEE